MLWREEGPGQRLGGRAHRARREVAQGAGPTGSRGRKGRAQPSEAHAHLDRRAGALRPLPVSGTATPSPAFRRPHRPAPPRVALATPPWPIMRLRRRHTPPWTTFPMSLSKQGQSWPPPADGRFERPFKTERRSVPLRGACRIAEFGDFPPLTGGRFFFISEPFDSPTAVMDGTLESCACAQRTRFLLAGEGRSGEYRVPSANQSWYSAEAPPSTLFPRLPSLRPAVPLVTVRAHPPASRYLQGNGRSVALSAREDGSGCLGSVVRDASTWSQEAATSGREGGPDPWASSSISGNFSSEEGAGDLHSSSAEPPADLLGHRDSGGHPFTDEETVPLFIPSESQTCLQISVLQSEGCRFWSRFMGCAQAFIYFGDQNK